MITLHHLHQSRSFRVVWLMEELGLPYDLICHQIIPGQGPLPALLAAHRLGKAPLVIDGETVLFESGAILEYMVHRYGHGRLSVPSHHSDYAAYLVWMFGAEGTCMPALVPLARHTMGLAPEPTEAQRAQHDRVLALCSETLAAHDYFAGASFTAADIMMETYLTAVTRFAAPTLSSHPGLAAYQQRLHARPAWRRANEVTDGHVPTS